MTTRTKDETSALNGTDAKTANHLWADRFHTPVADLFDMQDKVVTRLANALNTQLVEAEARRSARSRNPDATDLYFQDIACLNKRTNPEHLSLARSHFRRGLCARCRRMRPAPPSSICQRIETRQER